MIYNLQLLRAFAALSVVYLHVASDAGLNLKVDVGGFGVDVFFVISGYTMSYIRGNFASLFLMRRCIRIVPLYWIATLGTFFIAWLVPRLLQSAAADIPQLLHSLAFLPYPNKLGQIRPTLALGWTLNYEMYFYLFFTVALTVTCRFAPLVAAGLLGSVTAGLALIGGQNTMVVFYGDPIAFEFLYGIAAYYMVEMLVAHTVVVRHPRVTRFLLIGVAVASGCALPLQEYFLSGSRALLGGLPALLLVLSLVSLERNFALAAVNKWILLLGDSSYVLYLVHPYIVYGVIRLFLNPVEMRPLATVLFVVAMLVFAVIVAGAIHVAVERPLLNYLRRRWVTRDPSPIVLLHSA